MIPIFTFTIVLVFYVWVLTKFIESNMSVFWSFMWIVSTFGLIGSFMWWVFV